MKEEFTVVNKKLDGSTSECTATLENGIMTFEESSEPSSTQDVFSYTSISDFPAEGTENKLYVALDTSYVYIWDGSTYVQTGNKMVTLTQAEYDALVSAGTVDATTYYFIEEE